MATTTAKITAGLKREIICDAIEFLTTRYKLNARQQRSLAALPICWKRRRAASKFYMRATRGYAGPHILLCIARGEVARWHTYHRVRAGLVTPTQGIEMPVALFAKLVLIHELTHALQHGVCDGSKRRYSEVETTRNEIAFIEQVAPVMHSRLVSIGRSARVTNGKSTKLCGDLKINGLKRSRGLMVRKLLPWLGRMARALLANR